MPGEVTYREWEALRFRILKDWELGYGQAKIAERLGPSPHGNAKNGQRGARTIVGYYQRIYRELRIPKGHRTPSAALRMAYQTGILPCPCPHCPQTAQIIRARHHA